MSPVFALQGTAESMKMEITQQTVTVSGVVKDRKGEPIIGANIMEKGTANGTITDFDGKYTLNVKRLSVCIGHFLHRIQKPRV